MSGSSSAAFFNSTYYLQNNPDVVAAIAKGQFTSALQHFQQFGQYENRSPNAAFNGAQYLINNPDVAAAVGSKQLASAWAHFTTFGIAEDRNDGTFAGTFNEAAYLAANPDVAAAVKAGAFINGYQHFLLFGQNEGRAAFNTLGVAINLPNTLVALTTAVGTFAATNPNTTFTAVVNATAAAPTVPLATSTLLAGDQIKGLSGINTLSVIATTAGATDMLAGVTLTGIQSFALQNAGGGVDIANLNGNAAVTKVSAVNTSASGTDTFQNLATGTQIIATGSGTGAGTTVSFFEKNTTDAVSVTVDGGVNGVTFTNTAGTEAAASISSTGAANGKANVTVGNTTTVNVDTFTLTSASNTLKTLSVNASTNLVAALTASDYVTTGAALTVIGAATNVDLGSLGVFNTINASGLTAGGLKITTGATLTSLIGGAGANVITIGASPTAAATIQLGAGNDSLLGTSALLATGTADGGAGFNTVSTGLINAGNASKFTNFQDLSLQTATGVTFDVSLVAGITALSVDAANNGTTPIYSNVTLAQGLTDTFVGDNSANSNTLSFKGLSGTANSYGITFNGAAQTAAPTASNVLLGTVTAQGINNFTIASSGGANTSNSVTLGTDLTANTVAITGSQNLALGFATNFGAVSTTLGQTGVTLIDGSAATGKLSINLANVVNATAGLTVKGGVGADTITTSNSATTLTGGGGADVFNVAATVTTSAATSLLTTVTDATSLNKMTFAAQNTGLNVGATDTGFISTAVNIGTSTALSTALGLAAAADAAKNVTAGDVSTDWFAFGGNTYVLQHVGTGTTLGATDVLAQLTGTHTLTNSVYSTTNHQLNLA